MGEFSLGVLILIFILSVAALILSADGFIKVAEKIGLSIGISPFIVGVTLVALGTSLPELGTSIAAVFQANSSIILGNVVGSNIANICLVMGMLGILGGTLELKFDAMKVDLPIMIGAAFLLYLSLYNEKFSFLEGVLFLVGLAIYLVYIFSTGRADLPKGEQEENPYGVRLNWLDPVKILFTGALLYFSANFTIDSLSLIAKKLHVADSYVAQTALALGTSLPELVVSIVAIRRGNAELAIGNILGSNIFNIFCVMGVPRIVAAVAQYLDPEKGDLFVINAFDDTLTFGLPALILSSILCLIVLQDKKITRWEGWMLAMLYVVYIGNLTSMQLSG